MYVYRLSEPIDDFDGLTPLNEWLDGDADRLAWALRAVLALTEAALTVGWKGDMRHLPMGAVRADGPARRPALGRRLRPGSRRYADPSTYLLHAAASGMPQAGCEYCRARRQAARAADAIAQGKAHAALAELDGALAGALPATPGRCGWTATTSWSSRS